MVNKNGNAHCDGCGNLLYTYETLTKVFCSIKCSENYVPPEEKKLDDKWIIEVRHKCNYLSINILSLKSTCHMTKKECSRLGCPKLGKRRTK